MLFDLKQKWQVVADQTRGVYIQLVNKLNCTAKDLKFCHILSEEVADIIANEGIDGLPSTIRTAFDDDEEEDETIQNEDMIVDGKQVEELGIPGLKQLI